MTSFFCFWYSLPSSNALFFSNAVVPEGKEIITASDLHRLFHELPLRVRPEYAYMFKSVTPHKTTAPADRTCPPSVYCKSVWMSVSVRMICRPWGCGRLWRQRLTTGDDEAGYAVPHPAEDETDCNQLERQHRPPESV